MGIRSACWLLDDTDTDAALANVFKSFDIAVMTPTLLLLMILLFVVVAVPVVVVGGGG
jgi:hypothetical protein